MKKILTKKCSKCHVEKPEKFFHKAENKKDGLQNYCEECKGSWLKRAAKRLKGNLIYGKNKSVKDLKAALKEKPPAYTPAFIDYEDAPTGKAYIGIAKAPLMPNENGIGYQGVLLQDETRQFVQCSGCGKWAKSITSVHTKKCTGLSVKEFRAKFGLNLTQGLISDSTSARLTENALKNKESVGRFEGCRGKRGGGRKRTRQQENEHGTCPEQVKDRLYRFIVENHELPRNDNRGRAIYKVIWNRHHAFGRALGHYGLPTLERIGTRYKYTFPDHTVYSYNINQMYDREALYEMMIDKCPVLKPYLIQNV